MNKKKLKRFVFSALLGIVRLMPKIPLPLAVIKFIRMFSSTEIARVPIVNDQVVADGSRINHDSLAKLFSNTTFNSWTLDVNELNIIFQLIKDKKAKCLLEFGSGISTICFAQIMSELYKEDEQAIRIIAIEENEVYAKELEEKILSLGFNSLVKVLHTNVIDQVINGRSTRCYNMSNEIRSVIRENKPDFIMIDGPSSKSGNRYGVIPLVNDLVDSNTTFLLDDVFRDEELRIALEWEKVSYINVQGLFFIGRGLLKGFVN